MSECNHQFVTFLTNFWFHGDMKIRVKKTINLINFLQLLFYVFISLLIHYHSRTCFLSFVYLSIPGIFIPVFIEVIIFKALTCIFYQGILVKRSSCLFSTKERLKKVGQVLDKVRL